MNGDLRENENDSLRNRHLHTWPKLLVFTFSIYQSFSGLSTAVAHEKQGCKNGTEFLVGLLETKKSTFLSPQDGIAHMYLVIAVAWFALGFPEEIVGSVYLLSFCRHGKPGLLGMGSGALQWPQHWQKSFLSPSGRGASSPLFPCWKLGVFQTLILKLWKYWRSGMGLELAASCTGLVSSYRSNAREGWKTEMQTEAFTPENTSHQPLKAAGSSVKFTLHVG